MDEMFETNRDETMNTEPLPNEKPQQQEAIPTAETPTETPADLPGEPSADTGCAAVAQPEEETVSVSSGEYRDPYRESTVRESIEDYQPVRFSPMKTKEPVGKGIKIFAGLLAAVVLLTGSCTAGYLLGRHRAQQIDLFAETTMELEERPEDTDAYTTVEVYDMVNKSVVGITVYNGTNASRATGVIYTEDGYVITNDHIYSEIPNAKFKITTYDGTVYDAVYVAGDTRSDLAVLKIAATGFYPATFGNSDHLIVGESVLAIGRPTGVEENSLTRGVVSLKQRRLAINTSYSMKLIQTDAPINPGSSGGALTNLYGQVVGITSSKLSGTEYEGICFAIPTTTMKKVVESLILNGSVTNRAKLGITYYEVDEVSKEVGNYPSTGVLVGEVSSDSSLYGKLEKGDLIATINGQEITRDDVILDVIEQSNPGDSVILGVYKSNGAIDEVGGELMADTGSSSYQSGNNALPEIG